MKKTFAVLQSAVLVALGVVAGYVSFEWAVSNHEVMELLHDIVEVARGETRIAILRLFAAGYVAPLLLFLGTLVMTIQIASTPRTPEAKRKRATQLLREAEEAERTRQTILTQREVI